PEESEHAAQAIAPRPAEERLERRAEERRDQEHERHEAELVQGLRDRVGAELVVPAAPQESGEWHERAREHARFHHGNASGHGQKTRRRSMPGYRPAPCSA